MSLQKLLLCLGACLLVTASALGDLVRVGAGSYSTTVPEGVKKIDAFIFKTENVRGAMPTNDWWSSLAWAKESFNHYPHPLAVKVEPSGLRVAYPAANLTANKAGIFAMMPGGGDDFTLGHSAVETFAKPLVDGFSDWFVSLLFADGARKMRVSYGHGSPFVYAMFEGGQARLVFKNPPQVWSGKETSAVLGVTANGRHYGLFAPAGAKWSGLGTSTLTCEARAAHFSVAVLPDNAPETLALFARYAHAHVVDTRVSWSYDEKTSSVVTEFRFVTQPREGAETGTLYALYPHQWHNTSAAMAPLGYNSVRGWMKLSAGHSFKTQMIFPGVLPTLPNAGGTDRAKIAEWLKPDLADDQHDLKDTYWGGKNLGKLTSLVAIAEQYGLNAEASSLRDRLRERMESWFSAAGADGVAKKKGLFGYDAARGTLIGYPASYGSDTDLNDHHFHYGYFFQAAAAVARNDPAWAADARWGGMLKLLARDVASADRNDPMFPFLRNFDPYAGHSWASGFAKFADGNNNESSSEGMNAWCGMVLWGEATGDKALRDLGVWLFTTEMNAINEYWFDVRGENFPKSYTPSVATMIWGGKSVNETWFTADPAQVHGINWLPIHGGSLYLGRHPDYVEKNYAAVLGENKSKAWKSWSDIVWMYRALSDPRDAIAQLEAAGAQFPVEAGNSRANTAHWIFNLNTLGRVERSVSADFPLYAVFQNGKTRTYAAYNVAALPRTVTFSDGFKLQLKDAGFTLGKRAFAPPAK